MESLKRSSPKNKFVNITVELYDCNNRIVACIFSPIKCSIATLRAEFDPSSCILTTFPISSSYPFFLN